MVSGALLLLWCGLASQLALVVAKCLARLVLLAGSDDDGWFWGAVAAAAALPPLEAALVAQALTLTLTHSTHP